MGGAGLLSDDFFEYYEEAWTLRAGIMAQILATETSLARVLARFATFESRHVTAIVDNKLHFSRKPEIDPITRLETPVQAISCGSPVSAFAFSHTDLGGLIASLAVGCDTVAELGSGYGRRLIEAWLAGAPVGASYVGIEPTASGRDLADRLAALEPGLAFQSKAGDHATFNPAGFGGGRTLLVTSFTLMFAPTLGLDFFRRIAAIPGEVVCLFIEPVGFQLAPDSREADIQRKMFLRQNMNTNFFSVFNQAIAEGLLEPLFIGRDLFGTQGDPLTQGSVIVAAKI